MLRVTFVVISRVDHDKSITTTKTITIKPPPGKRDGHRALDRVSSACGAG